MSDVVNPVVGSTPTIEITLRDEAGNLVDLTEATVTIILKSPAAAAVPFAGTLSTTPSDGVVKYICTTADLNVPGIWHVQAHAVFTDLLEYYSNIETFTVDPKLE
jgi:hypothetical protein